ncbi:MAG: hypothetical protein ACOC2L_00725 [Candidatus Sumerlaeota bacterium]
MTENNQSTLDRSGSILLTITVLAAIIFGGYFLVSEYLVVSHGHPPVARSKADMRSLATGIESYLVDNHAYPPHTYDPSRKVLWAGPADVPTFDQRYSLTTPVSFVSRYPIDYYNSAGRGDTTFSWWTNGRDWFLASMGPDGDFDIDYRHFERAITYIAVDDDGTTHWAQDGAISETYFTLHSFDSTNGSFSSGDLFHFSGTNPAFGPSVAPSYSPRFPDDITRTSPSERSNP